jgi:hypothetical protein
MRSTSIRISTVIITLALFGLVASGFAQSTYGPDGSWGHRGMGSLRTTMQTMRAEFEAGDRESAREHGPTAERLWKDLAPRDEAFSKGLKALLSKKQLEAYRKWEKEQIPQRHWGRPPGPPTDDNDAGRI